MDKLYIVINATRQDNIEQVVYWYPVISITETVSHV